MSDNERRRDVSRCRVDMAELLAKAIATTLKLEESLDFGCSWSEATVAINLDTDPDATLRIQGALLLRKARIHSVVRELAGI